MKRSTTKHALANLAAVVFGCLTVIHAAPVQAEPANAKASRSETGKVVTDSLEIRFADGETSEIPDFQKHVIPLLGRLGCNGRACHGSFQGRGGFQLSLFGYDFKADHAAMLDESSGRVDVDDVDESLILVKPLDADVHEGGKRFDEGSWQHHVLRRWIESGARNDSETPQDLTRLEIVPEELRVHFRRGNRLTCVQSHTGKTAPSKT